MTDHALVLADVTKRYRAGRQIGPVDLAIPAGTCFALVGANGAGKTTVMRLMLGLDLCTSGSVQLFGEPIQPGRPSGRSSGMIEEPRFFNWLDATANLRAVFPRCPAATLSRVLVEVGLVDAGDKPVGKFSQGMRQRLGIARVLVAEPEVMVLDEPTNGLDPHGIRWFRGLVERLVTDGKTVVVSSHMLHEVQRMATHYLMLDQGRPVASGLVAEIQSYPSLEDLYLAVVGQGVTST